MSKINIYNEKVEKYTGKVKKVSVIIPNYNYSDFIIERIDSILNQSYPIYELIILDDKSTDDSVKIIQEKIKTIKNVKVRFIENKKNSGSVFSQWKKGISLVEGDYFWIAEADDSSNRKFLETVMRGFNNKNVILSYTDSARIDENNNLIKENCQDLYNIYNTNRWDKPYINKGTDEIINYLSITNTILNVSGVVWKNGDYSKIIDEAKNFRVAGDWYIYYKLLELGDIAFDNQSLNYFRKHSKSVSTVVKADIEYNEICKLQDEIANKYKVSMQIYKDQRRRRSYMDHNVSKDVRKKRIAWVIPHPGKGSGGHRTIIQNVNALIRHGYECDIYVEEDYISTDRIVAEKINQYYELCAANVYVGIKFRQEYDLVFNTGWQTIDFVKSLDCPKKAYFIQDFEPWFFPMGVGYILTENSYRLGYLPVTIGKWLSHKMINEYDNNSRYFDFCADLNVYKPLKNIKKENAICYIYQPEKDRRCDIIALRALKLVKALKPDVKIYLYGSNTQNSVDFESEKLGIIPLDKCNELYNKCTIGLCMSASNPSRIPFEMMAAGLPVVELYKENNLYDFPDNAISLAEPSPEGIATALLQLLNNKKICKEMGEFGIKYMKNYPLEKGFAQFIEAVDAMFTTNYNEKINVDMMYKKSPIKPSDEVINASKEILKCNILIDYKGEKWRKLRRTKRKVKEKSKGALNRISNLIDRI